MFYYGFYELPETRITTSEYVVFIFNETRLNLTLNDF